MNTLNWDVLKFIYILFQIGESSEVINEIFPIFYFLLVSAYFYNLD